MKATGTQIMHNGARDTWPGEREPGSSDAESAYQQVNGAFFASFKNAMLMKTRTDDYIEFLQPGKLNPLLAAENKMLKWPISSLSDQAEEDHGCSATDLEKYVKVCCEEYIPKAPFLRDIPAGIFYQQPEPLYFTLAMACLGSMLNDCPAEKSTALWWSSFRMLLRKLEVDNREARKTELVKAWILLETYGLLSSDLLTWNRTCMGHGYVETALWRLLDSTEDSQKDTRTDLDRHGGRSDLSSISLYFALIDLLRSIHFGQASSLAAPEIISKVRRSPETARLGSDQHQPQAPRENGLIELIGILSDIHIVATVFDPLFRVHRSSAEDSTKWKLCDHIPFSGMNELAEMTCKLRANLEIWQNAHFRTSTTELSILWHFCSMYLALPSVQLLIELSEYSCRAGNFNTLSDTTLLIGAISGDLGRGKEAVEHAWKILQLSSDCESTLATSIWRPFALFTAALTIWANISIEEEANASISLKILQLFEAEITMLKFPCSNEMSAVLKRLQGAALVIRSGQ